MYIKHYFKVFIQVIGVIVSCFVAVAGRKESRNYQVV